MSLAKKKSGAYLYFARFDSLMYIVDRSQEKSCSLSLLPFLVRYRSFSLSLRVYILTAALHSQSDTAVYSIVLDCI